MGREPTTGSFFTGLLGKILRRKLSEPPQPVNTPLAMLEQLHAGAHPDYCLYLRPAAGGAAARTSLLSVDLEKLLAKAFHPLPVVTLDEAGAGAAAAALPDEAFLTLANRARVLCLIPMPDPRFMNRLRILKTIGPIARCIFVMPEQGTVGTADWPANWPAARAAAASLGIELSEYTAGGWVFRLDPNGKAVTFRPIVNPNPEKIARALEAICVEM